MLMFWLSRRIASDYWSPPSNVVPPKWSPRFICNFGNEGVWVPRDSSQGFGYKSCQVDVRQNCSKNDVRWVPAVKPGCSYRSFTPRDFLTCTRDKKILWIGDSLSRNHFQSLICLLDGESSSLRAAWPFWALAYYYSEMNTTLTFMHSNFLMDVKYEKEVTPVAPMTITWETLDASIVDTLQRDHYDVIIVNSGPWWRLREGNFSNNLFRVSQEIEELVSVETILVWRYETAEHNKVGTTCVGLNGLSEMKQRFDNMVDSVLSSRWQRLDLRGMTARRPEGHPAALIQIPGRRTVDCMHWCLPGVPDAWNEVLFSMLCPT